MRWHLRREREGFSLPSIGKNPGRLLVERIVRLIGIVLVIIAIAIAIVELFTVRWLPPWLTGRGYYVSLIEHLTATFPWPYEWDFSAQATLAAAIITLLGGTATTLVANHLQNLSVATQNKISAQDQSLDKFQKYSVNIYVPLLNAVSGLSGWLGQSISNPNDFGYQSAFYWFCRFRSLSARLTFDRTYLLKEIEAEKALLTLGALILAIPIADGYLTNPDVALISELFQTSTKFAGLKVLLRKPRFFRVFSRFRKWVKNDPDGVRRVIQISGLYADLMVYEINLIYEAWYGAENIPKLSKETLRSIGDLVSPKKQGK